GATIFLGGAPDEDLKFRYYNTWRRRLEYVWNVKCLGRESGIGNWWSRESMEEICRRLGLSCEFRQQSSCLHTAHYRFDAVVTFGGPGPGRRRSAPERVGLTNPPRETSLAVNGGQPAFSEPLHVGRPNIGDRDRLASRLA